MNRTTLSLIGAATALAAVTGFASLTAPSSDEPDPAARSATRLPVERSTLLCPAPTSSDVGETTYTAYTPKGKTAGKGGASLLPAQNAADDEGGDDTGDKDGKGKDSKGDKGDKGDKGKGDTAKPRPVVPLKEAGKPVSTTTDRSDAPALIGTADGGFAPGWSVQQTTQIDAGSGRGLQGTSCTAPDTDFWFPAASIAKDRQDYVHLTNPDATPAVVDVELYGPEGRIDAPTGEEISVPARSTVAVLLSTLTTETATDVTAHVAARSGRVGAAVQASDESRGGDWLAAAAEPTTGVVIPGIPADATSVRLVAFAPGGNDADLNLKLAGHSASFTPAGHESLHVKSGMTTDVDLGDVTKGEPGSLVLTPQSGTGGSAPVVAAARVTRGKGSDQETAFIPATARIEQRATAADNRDKDATLALTATGADAKVRVTASAGSDGGSPAEQTYVVKRGTTRSVEPPRPASGKGSYALTVERLSGGPVYASRMLARKQDGVPMFTIQPMPDDRGMVAVPKAEQDLSVLND